MGAAGDMLMAALLELHPDPDNFLKRFSAIGIPGVEVTADKAMKCGITGTHVTVKVYGQEEVSHDHNHDHEHTHDHGHTHEHHHEGDHHHKHSHSHDHVHTHGHSHEHSSAHSHDHNAHKHQHNEQDSHSHGSYHDIGHMIGHLDIAETVKENALGVYRLIAEAESHAHGVPVDKIHFHEVGELDAIADIVGVCMLIEELAPEIILASPIHVGSGHVRCAHGILPVPAPATAYILKDAPIYGGDIRGELCTPTGAALLKYFAKDFGSMPVMKAAKIGYGMGKKDFERANCVRLFLGETKRHEEEVTELICNLDDMTPEAIAFAQQLLLDEGALDVYTMPIGMKKGRSGILFTCMCRQDERDRMLHLIFKHTTTLGIRETVSRRYTLSRTFDEVQTPYGALRTKTAQGYGVSKTKVEYDDIAKIAKDNDLSISQIMDEIS